jgi:uncharacterized membrane protein YbhN (UPF0104 family)
MNYINQKFTIFLKIFIVLIILLLIFKEINDQYYEIVNTVLKFNINYVFVTFIFYILSQLIFSYLIFLIYSQLFIIKLHHHYKIIFTGQFLDYLPFLGFLYKAKILKNNFKLSYKQYVSTYAIQIFIGLFSILSILNLLLFLPIENIIDLNINVKNFIIFLFISIIIFSRSSHLFLKILKGKKYFIYILKKKINIFELFIILFQMFNEFFLNKLSCFKFILMQISGLLILNISFFFIFKIYQIEASLFNIILIFMFLVFSTLVKIVPKNYGFEELAGSYLIEIITGSFAMGLVVMISFRILSIIGSMLLFIIFNIKLSLK